MKFIFLGRYKYTTYTLIVLISRCCDKTFFFEIVKYADYGRMRYFKMILPVDGTAKQTSWVVGQEVYSFEVDF